MFTLKRFMSGSLFLFMLAGIAMAQGIPVPVEMPREVVATGGSAPVVTATATAERVRFVSPGTVVQLRLEVYNETGQKLFDTELHGGNVLDWHLQDGAGGRLPAGTYACVLTTKSLSGRLSQRVGRVTVTVNEQKAMVEGATQLSVAQQQTIGPVEGSAALTVVQEIAAEAITAITHDGKDGRVTSTRGALTFGTGDVFAGNEVERMRITAEGNVGIGTDKPEARLDVAGDIRSTGVLRLDKGIEFADGTRQTTGLSGRMDSEGNLVPNVAGTGTQGRLAKWTDNVGTLGNSVVTEAASGKLGIGTVNPNYEITLFGNDVGLQLISAASGTTANDGFRFGVSSTNNAFLWNAEATDLYFGTTATERMRIKANGNVGIGTNNPSAKLDVAGDAKVSSNLTVDTNTLFVDATNDRVGIGTTAPLARLDVAGNVRVSGGGNGFIFADNTTMTTAGATLGANSFSGNQSVTGNVSATGTLSATGVVSGGSASFTGDVNTSTQYNIGGNRVLSVPGINNVFAGVGAGQNNSGSANSFFGRSAGRFNTTGGDNSFFGQSAGLNNTTGSSNSFFGNSAGDSNTTGGDNSFFGQSAGRFNTTGFLNSFFGRSAGLNNTTGVSNSFFGGSAGSSNTIGVSNSFFGEGAGFSNTTGGDNSFFGQSAGVFNTTGGSNSFFGQSAGFGNTTGGDNSFFGKSAGQTNTTGQQNAFFGATAGDSNTTGNFNSFVGFGAGQSNTTGGANSFFGKSAGFGNSTGAANSFFGRSAGFGNTTGGNNSFFGDGAGFNNTTGVNNSFFGQSAGLLNTTGGSNTIIGTSADVGSGNLSFATAIGSGAIVTASNTVQIGRTTVDQVAIGALASAASVQVCINNLGVFATCSSSLRYKENVRPLTQGLSLVGRLRPVTFKWKERDEQDLGLIAEEVAEVAPSLVFNNQKGEIEGVKYSQINAVLISAVQEQQEQMQQRQARIEKLEARLAALETVVKKLGPGFNETGERRTRRPGAGLRSRAQRSRTTQP